MKRINRVVWAFLLCTASAHAGILDSLSKQLEATKEVVDQVQHTVDQVQRTTQDTKQSAEQTSSAVTKADTVTPVVAKNTAPANQSASKEAAMPVTSVTTLPYLKSKSWNPGEIALVKSPDPQIIRPMLLSMFRGLPRLGTPLGYGVSGNSAESDEAYRTMNERHALKSDLAHSRSTYFSLLALGEAREQLPKEGLVEGYENGIGPGATRSIGVANDWFRFFTTLAGTTLTEVGCGRYLTLDQQPCPQGGHYLSVSANQSGSTTWGGGPHREATEARGRGAYRDFVEHTLPHYVRWSQQLSREVYLVSATSLGSYDPALGGLVMSMPPIKWDRQARSQRYTSFPAHNPRPVKSHVTEEVWETMGYEGTNFRYLWKISQAKAEALLAPMRSRIGGAQVYYAYKVKLQPAQDAEPASRPNPKYPNRKAIEDRLRLTGSFIAKPSSAVLEVFADEALQEKLFEIPIV